MHHTPMIRRACADEWWQAITALAWGLWLLAPWWDSFGTVATFRQLSLLAPEWVWASAVIAVALLNLISLRYGCGRLRLASSYGLAFMWLFLAWSFYASVPQSTAAILNFMLFLRQATLLAAISTRRGKWTDLTDC